MPQVCTAPIGMSPTPAQESIVEFGRKSHPPQCRGQKSMLVVPWSY
jgi:hypothetical protein